MRFLLGGLLILAWTSAALAQTSGQVLQVGFGNAYRPDAWTPMLVQLTNSSADAGTFQIQVLQEDLDRDRVVCTQTVSVGGAGEGRTVTENFWVYFRPQPTGGGLPDATDNRYNLADLTRALRVYLCDTAGRQLVQLPITSTIVSVDPKRSLGESGPPRRLVVFVTDGNDKVRVREAGTLVGVKQDLDDVVVQPKDLPDSVLGYDGVDALVWLDADASFLTQGTRSPALDAIFAYVRGGGHLVVCQSPEPYKDKAFDPLLPVITRDDGMVPVFDRRDVDALRRIVRRNSSASDFPALAGPFKVGKTVPAPGAKVDEWIEWATTTTTAPAAGAAAASVRTPFLARRGVGLGCVTWVAQDLGAGALSGPTADVAGWASIWNRVLDAGDQPRENYQRPKGDALDPFPPGAGVDLGSSLLSGMELSNKAVYLISVAALFFVAYWAVAGPGVYFYLVAKKQQHLSWFAFGATAVVAAGLTVILVKLVVRGPPELRHLSAVQTASGDPLGHVRSRFGLYIPQDGVKHVALDRAAAHQVSWIAPFGIHPQYVNSDETFSAYLTYALPVPSAADTGEVALDVPYRSTLKKLQAEWVGELKERIDVQGDGVPSLVPAGNGGYLRGSLVNRTGRDLSDCWLAFKFPAVGTDPGELSVKESTYACYVPAWKAGDGLDLSKLFKTENVLRLDVQPNETPRRPDSGKVVYGQIGGVNNGLQLEQYWYASDLRQPTDAAGAEMSRALPMLAFYEQLAPMAVTADGDKNRSELLRRGARHYDVSQAITAGNLVVIGHAPGPIPLPLTVGGNPVAGDGQTLYEAVLPLDRAAVEPMPNSGEATKQ